MAWYLRYGSGKLAINSVFNQPDEYWKMQRYSHLSAKEMTQLLADRGYHIGAIKHKETLQYHLSRVDRGLPSYIGLTNDELRLAVRIRGFGNEIDGKGGRGDLQNLLTRHDNNRTFYGFVALPPELRARIFECYYANFRKPLHCPAQPPITLVSSLVRLEALPIFYSSFTFELNMLWVSERTLDVGGECRLKFRRDTRGWIDGIGAANIADIQHLRIRVFSSDQDSNNAQIDILLEWSKSKHEVFVNRWKNAWPRASDDDMRDEFGKLAVKVTARSDGGRLQREDLYPLRVAVERSLE